MLKYAERTTCPLRPRHYRHPIVQQHTTRNPAARPDSKWSPSIATQQYRAETGEIAVVRY